MTDVQDLFYVECNDNYSITLHIKDVELEKFITGIYNDFCFLTERIMSEAIGVFIQEGIQYVTTSFSLSLLELIHTGIISKNNSEIYINVYGDYENKMKQIAERTSLKAMQNLVEYCVQNDRINHLRKLKSFGIDFVGVDLEKIFI